MISEQEMSTKNVCLSSFLKLFRFDCYASHVWKRNSNCTYAEFDLSTVDTFFVYMSQGKEQKRKHTEAITKVVKKWSAVHFQPGQGEGVGGGGLLAAASCS